MADPTGLFDALAGASGHPINRPGMNTFIANSQAINGLRSAQTEEALQKAQKAQEDQEAGNQLESALGDLMGPNNASKAHAAATMMKGHFGNAKEAMDALNAFQQNQFHQTLGDPTQLNTPEQTAASQGATGKLAEPFQVHPEFATPAGVTTPNVQQTPGGQATTAEHTAAALLHTQQALHPEQFHTAGGQPLDPAVAQDVAEFIRQNPNLAGNIRSLVSNGGGQVVHAFLHPEVAPGAAPVPAAAPGVSQPSALHPANGIVPAPGVSLKEQADIRHAFANGVESRQTTSLNTLINHSLLFDQIADQMHNGNFTPTNAISQMWQKTFGSPVPPNLGIAASFLGREAVRATVNSGSGTGEERELAVDAHSSPDQLHGAAQTLRALGAGQLHSLEVKARRGGVDLKQLLGPEAQQAFGMNHSAAPGGAAPGGIPPQAVAQLKEGHVTQFGNGQKWTLQGGQPVQVP